MKRTILVLMQLLLFSSIVLTPMITAPARAQTVGLVCLAPEGSTQCPPSPPILTGPVGSQLRVAVLIQGSDFLNGVDITLNTNSTVLRPADADFTGTVVPGSITVIAKCVQGVAVQGVCGPGASANPNTLELAIVGTGLTLSPVTGLLFTAIFNIIAPSPPGGTPIEYRTGCTTTSTPPNLCITVANGTITPVPETSQGAVYVTSGGFSTFTISSSPTSLSIPAGLSTTAALLIIGFNFTGTVDLLANAFPVLINGPLPTISPATVQLFAGFNDTAHATLTVSTSTNTPPGPYTLAVNGTGNGLTQQVLIPLTVTPPSSNVAWVLKAAIPTAREGYGAATVGRTIYYIAGYHNGDTTVNEAYNPDTDSWTTKTSLPGSPRSETVAVSDGTFVYLIGGRPVSIVGNELWRYNPADDSWTSLAPMPTARATEHLAAYSNGRIYVIGGRTSSAPGSGGVLTTVEIYNIASNTWTTGTPMPEGRSDAQAVEANGKIYLFGGFDSGSLVRDTTFIYDINSDSWATGAPIPAIRASASAGVCGGSIYVAGGVDQFEGLQTSTYKYDPSADSWSVSAPLIVGTAEAQAVSLPGTLFVVSGGIFGSGSFNSVSQALACPGNLLYVSPPSRPVQPAGTSLNYTIKVSNMTSFTAWDIMVRVDPNVIKPLSLTITGNLFTANFTASVSQLINCVNGVGTGCTGSDGLGIVHSAANVTTSDTLPPTLTGLLFTITYTVQGGTFSEVDILNDRLTNGACCPVQHTTLGGTYGRPPPDFFISVFPTNLNIGQGSSATSTIFLRSSNNFTSSINLSATVSPAGPSATLNPASLTLGLNGTATSLLTISTTNSTPAGTYNVTVTATGGTRSHTVRLLVRVIGDFRISANPQSLTLPPGSTGASTITLNSTGFDGTLALSATVTPIGFSSPQPTLSQNFVFLSPGGSQTVTVGIITFLNTPIGSYTVTVTASGFLSHSVVVTVNVPPPTLTVTPSSGLPGAKVTIHGSGFPVGSPFPTELEVTFDNQLVGLTFIQNSSFDFTFSVPLSEPGLHHIHAVLLFLTPNIDVQADFTVLPQPTTKTLTVSVNVGTIYFPGDSTDIYVLTSLNGVPVGPVGVQLHLTLIRPNKTNTTLTAVFISPGLFKATLPIPQTNSLGTYAIIATAQLGSNVGSALATFEVKPTWLSTQRQNLTVATGVAGVALVMGLAWRGGYLRRKEENPAPPIP